MTICLIYLVFLVSQLGRHFWFDWSFVSGVKIDYLSPTLYFVDLLWITILIFNLQSSINKQRKISGLTNEKTEGIVMPSLLIILLAIVNILVANRWQVAVYGWFRLWQIWWWANYFSKHKKEVIKLLKWIIPWWIGIETLLALGQVVGGGSMGGIFYWLGERRFDYMSLSIARISWFGDQYVRAYGTFSHPNSLAGFLLVGIILINKIGRAHSNVPVQIRKWIINWIGVVGIILTGSRLVWGVGIIILLFKKTMELFKNNQGMIRKRMEMRSLQKIKDVFGLRITKGNKGRQGNAFRTRFGLIFIGIGVFIMGMSVLMANFEIVGGWSVNSLDLRWKLLKSGWSMWRQNWLFGVGLNNFLVNLAEFMKGYWWLQPVHNIFALFLVETGLVGLILIGSFLIKRIDFRKYAWVWLVIALTGLFDHYWLTLPQNMGLLGLVMGLSMRDRATKG